MSPAPLLPPAAWRLVLVTDRLRAALPVADALARALPVLARHGVARRTAVLVRERDLDDLALETLARQLLGITGEFGAPLLLAGRPILAARLEVGTHLGGQDVTPDEARRLAGPTRILTCARHRHDGPPPATIDAVFAAPVFPTRSKPDAAPLGLDGLRQLVTLSRVPTFALGGLETPGVLPAVLGTGARGIAVRHAILGVEAPEAAAERFGAALAALDPD